MDEWDDAYIEIVTRNWSRDEWENYSREIRAWFATLIRDRDGFKGMTFNRIWAKTFTIEDEVFLAGMATLAD